MLHSRPWWAFLTPINFCFYRNNNNYEQYRQPDKQTTVFYDHACPLCRIEMMRLKNHDKHSRLKLIDISDPHFDARDWGVSQEDLSAAMHILTANGEWLTGMQAIRYIYAQVGLGWIMALTGLPVISSLADRFYFKFAPNRTAISRWLGLHSGPAVCSNAVCQSSTPNKQRKGL